MKRKFLIISAFLAALMLLSACDGNKSPGAGTETVTKEETQNNSGTTPETVPETATVVTEFDGGVKLYSNGVLDFGDVLDADSMTVFQSTVEKIEAEKLPCGGIHYMKIGALTIKVHFNKRTDSNSGVYGSIDSLSAMGQNKDFPEALQLTGNFRLCAFEADESVIFAQMDRTVGNESMAASTTFIFQKDGIYQIENVTPPGVMSYNNPNITLYKDNNGRLCYRKMLEKYFGNQGCGGELEYCTARDEFCCEYGSVSFDGITPIYTAEKIETVSDHFDIEQLFDDWKICVELPYETLDEYLAHNAEIFQRGY